VESRQIIATAGADDAIDRAFRALAGPASRIASTTPGFVEFLDASARTQAIFVPLFKKPGDKFPVDRFCTLIRAEKPSIAVIASPDNPAGTMLPMDDFFRISLSCRAENTVFLLDVTYIDFADDKTLFKAALETPGVLLTGSFSKSRGLAGFRAGWAMTGSESSVLIDKLRNAGPPFSLSSPAIEAVRMAIAESETRYGGFVKRIAKERRELESALASLGARTWPSQANFVSAVVPDADSFVANLKTQGIFVRSWLGKTDAKGLVRITCPGEETSFDRLLSALRRMEAFS
jgi:histidinol-phosphate aminotransferase